MDDLLAEQLAYYRAKAPEYTETALPDLADAELQEAEIRLLAALDAFHPSGDVLELACGPGTWTGQLLRHASRVTAVDGAAEMLAIAKSTVNDDRARFIQADLFEWEPGRRYDTVFFGFWISHVPHERFDRFWALVDSCLKPAGRVAFVDDAYRTPEELLGGHRSSVIRRRLLDGTPFRAIKVPHTSAGLQQRLSTLGWDISVRTLAGPFYWGEGTRGSTLGRTRST